jgi:hypothetical protein
MRQGCRIGAAKDGFTASAEIAIRSDDFSWSRAPTGSRFSGALKAILGSLDVPNSELPVDTRPKKKDE